MEFMGQTVSLTWTDIFLAHGRYMYISFLEEV